MNVSKLVPLADLKEGKLYFVESELEEDWTHKKFYMFAIIKIKKIQLKPDQKKLINYSYSFLENYNIFSEITGFNTICNYFSDACDFSKRYIQSKNSTTKYYFYNFDEEWFFKNKEKILSHMTCSYSRKSLPEIFQEIEMEKK